MEACLPHARRAKRPDQPQKCTLLQKRFGQSFRFQPDKGSLSHYQLENERFAKKNWAGLPHSAR